MEGRQIAARPYTPATFLVSFRGSAVPSPGSESAPAPNLQEHGSFLLCSSPHSAVMTCSHLWLLVCEVLWHRLSVLLISWVQRRT